MKRFLPTFLVLVAFLVGYWAWPFFALRGLANALRGGRLLDDNGPKSPRKIVAGGTV